MPDYSAPLADMRFVLENIVDLPALAALPGFEHAEPEMVYGVLEESGRLFTQELRRSTGWATPSTAGATTTAR